MYTVIATCLDPLPGYCTNYFGLNGVLGVAGAGLSRIIYGNTSNRSNVVCADFVINSTLAVIWDSLSNAYVYLFFSSFNIIFIQFDYLFLGIHLVKQDYAVFREYMP